jgi:hypothetical protein
VLLPRWMASATALGLAGCMTWHPIQLAREPAPRGLPFVLRVTRSDSTRITMLAPFLRGDSLYGRVAADTVGLPLDDVRVAERQRFEPIGTFLVVVMVPVAVLYGLYVLSCGPSGNGCANSPS